MEIPDFKLTVDRYNKPLIIWNNPPGLFAEFYPSQLRILAEKLNHIANIAESKT